MKGRFLLPFLFVLINYLPPGISQGTGIKDSLNKVITDSLIANVLVQDDSIKPSDIILSRDQAIQVLRKSQKLQSLTSIREPFRSA